MQPGRRQVFLFLQGPITPYFARVADALEARGHRCLRVNLCFGDWMFWRRAGGVNFRGTRETWPAFIADLIDREGVTDLMLLGEQRYYHKVAVAAAKARGLNVTVTDFGYLRPDWITLERDGMSGDSCFPKDPEAVLALAAQAPEPDLVPRYRDSFWLQAVWDMGYHLMSNWLWWLYPGYKSHQVHHNALIYLGTGLHMLRSRRTGPRVDALVRRLREAGTTYYVLPLQMENDFQLRAYSPFFDLRDADPRGDPFLRRARAGGVAAAGQDPPPRSRHPQLGAHRAPLRGEVGRVRPGRLRRWRRPRQDAGRLPRRRHGQQHRRPVVDARQQADHDAGRRDLRHPGPDLSGRAGDILDAGRAAPARAVGRLHQVVANIQIRGVYYKAEGMAAAVEATASRLDLTQGAWLETRSRARTLDAGDEMPGIEALQNA